MIICLFDAVACGTCHPVFTLVMAVALLFFLLENVRKVNTYSTVNDALNICSIIRVKGPRDLLKMASFDGAN